MAGPTIQFVGRVSTEEKARLLTAAKGLIFANEEDFGIAPVEALAAGTPVIAYQRGGVTETVTDRVTGLFFSEQSTEALKRALDEFEKLTFDPKVLRKSAEIYDSRQFGSKFSKLVEKGYREYIKKNS